MDVDDPDEPDVEEGAAPRPPARRKPETIQIRSSNPIPPGRIDVAPTGRSGGPEGRVTAMIAAGLVVALVIGAGVVLLRSRGDDPEPSSPAAAVTDGPSRKDRFVARGDALCKRSTRAQERLLYPASADEFQTYLEDVREIVVGLIDDLKDLPRPKEDRRLLGRLFDRLDRLPALLTEAQTAAANGDVTEIETILGRAEKVEHEANALALQYGFAECSQP